jgi:hypothetical protein
VECHTFLWRFRFAQFAKDYFVSHVGVCSGMWWQFNMLFAGCHENISGWRYCLIVARSDVLKDSCSTTTFEKLGMRRSLSRC